MLSGDESTSFSDRLEHSGERTTSSILMSAKQGNGIHDLLLLIEQKLNSARREVELIIPYSKYEAMNLIREKGMLLSEEHLENGTRVKAFLDEAEIGLLEKILGIKV